MSGEFLFEIIAVLGDWLMGISCCSPSMDEAATKEELRPVKKQLVRAFFFFHSYRAEAEAFLETTEIVWGRYAERRQGRVVEGVFGCDWTADRSRSREQAGRG